MLLSPAVNLSPTSLIPAVKANNMTDTGGKLTAGDNDAGCNLPPVTTTSVVKNASNISLITHKMTSQKICVFVKTTS
jgi:hypothetical protein